MLCVYVRYNSCTVILMESWVKRQKVVQGMMTVGGSDSRAEKKSGGCA